MCDTPAGARPSGSNSTSAKLFVPAGTPDQASGGDTFSPTQFGLRCLSAHAFLTASVPLSCICGDVRVSTSAALARRDSAKPPASNTVPSAYFIAFSSPLLVLHGCFYNPYMQEPNILLFFRQFQKQNLHSAFWRRSAHRGLYVSVNSFLDIFRPKIRPHQPRYTVAHIAPGQAFCIHAAQ